MVPPHRRLHPGDLHRYELLPARRSELERAREAASRQAADRFVNDLSQEVYGLRQPPDDRDDPGAG